MRHVFETMGTVASIVLPPDCPVDLGELERVFAGVDERFSLYRPESELSEIARGSLTLTDASETLRDSYARALEWRTRTGGLFTPHRPDGVLDLNGIVKAEAIERAGRLLESRGCVDWSIDVGGDILVGRGRRWPTGVVDPNDRAALVADIDLGGDARAMATSGSAERGDHIWRSEDPGAVPFVQVSVVAGDIVTADVLATAIVAGGPAALDDICERWPVSALAVDRAGFLWATPGFRAAARSASTAA